MTVTRTDFFGKWRVWGLSAFGTALGPWQDKLTQVSLISDWFQPALNVTSSLVGPLVCLVTFAVLHSRSRARQQRFCRYSVAAFFICLLSCLALRLSVGVVLFPSPTMQVLVWVVWAALYL